MIANNHKLNAKDVERNLRKQRKTLRKTIDYIKEVNLLNQI